MRYLAPFLLLSLAACGADADSEHEDVQRVSLEDMAPRQAEADPSPDTSAASWSVSPDGQAIMFGNAGDPPLLTLACEVDADPPALLVIRHARALPGQKALFPVMGNGSTSRFLVDAVLANNEWHWQARLPADDPQLEVFAGPRDIEATLPGRGMLEIAGSRYPGEFIEWCKVGGRPQHVVVDSDEAGQD